MKRVLAKSGLSLKANYRRRVEFTVGKGRQEYGEYGKDRRPKK